MFKDMVETVTKPNHAARLAQSLEQQAAKRQVVPEELDKLFEIAVKGINADIDDDISHAAFVTGAAC